MKIINFLIVTCFLSISGTKAQTIPSDSRVDQYVNKEMEEMGTTGMAVAVIKDGKILHKNTYGTANIEYGIPVGSHTSFALASVTKLMTSTLVMRLVQEKKISLEDPVGKYVPNAVNWKDIRIKHLLAHEGGMPWPSSFYTETTEEIITKLVQSPLVYSPGAKQSYGNGDYFVLQYIVEKLYGGKFEDILEKELLKYLNMNDGGYDREVRGAPYLTMKAVKNKSQNFPKGTNGSMIYKTFFAPSTYSAGGLFLSVDDFIQWAKVLDEGKVISKEIQKQAYLPTDVPNAGFSRMGWTFKKNNGLTLVGHSGGPGLADVIRVPDENLTVIVLTNNTDLNPYMAEQIVKIYYPQIQPGDMTKTK